MVFRLVSYRARPYSVQVSNNVPYHVLTSLASASVFAFGLRRRPNVARGRLYRLQYQQLQRVLPYFGVVRSLPRGPQVSLYTPYSRRTVASNLFFRNGRVLHHGRVSISSSQGLCNFFCLASGIPIYLTKVRLLPNPSVRNGYYHAKDFHGLYRLRHVSVLIVGPFTSFCHGQFFSHFCHLFGGLSYRF